MTDHLRVPLGTLPDGSHFWDPDELFTGSKIVEIHHHKERRGTARVLITRYKPGRGQLIREKTYWSLTEMVVPGEMPEDVKAEAQAALDATLDRRRQDMAETAARLAAKGFDIKNIAGHLKVGEAEARQLVQNGIAALDKKEPEATVERFISEEEAKSLSDDDLDDIAPKGPAPGSAAPIGEVKAGRDPQELVDRKAYVLRCEGKSFNEIASRIGYSSGASARRAYNRGKKLAEGSDE